LFVLKGESYEEQSELELSVDALENEI